MTLLTKFVNVLLLLWLFFYVYYSCPFDDHSVSNKFRGNKHPGVWAWGHVAHINLDKNIATYNSQSIVKCSSFTYIFQQNNALSGSLCPPEAHCSLISKYHYIFMGLLPISFFCLFCPSLFPSDLCKFSFSSHTTQLWEIVYISFLRFFTRKFSKV